MKIHRGEAKWTGREMAKMTNSYWTTEKMCKLLEPEVPWNRGGSVSGRLGQAL